MGLIKIIDTDHHHIGIWKMEEEKEQLAPMVDQRIASEKEWNRIHHPQKQIEWLSSRVLLSQMLEQTKESFKGMVKDEFGKPFIQGCSKAVGLSHTHGHAAAILSSKEFTGVDIETNYDKAFLLREKFCNEDELSWILDSPKRAAIIWSAKESLYKAYGKKGLIFKEDMQMSEALDNQNEIKFHFNKINQQIKLRVVQEADYLVTFTA